MKSSTASHIAYNLRPCKQAERRILLDFLKCANEAGLSLAGCRYVGMGGTVFYDFHLAHRFLGIREMVSLERDDEIYPRCEFNRPFDFIKVVNQTCAEFLAADRSTNRTVYWFDYDDGINTDITGDIASLGARAKVGSFAFVTVCAVPPGALQKQKPDQRLHYFQENMGDFAVGLTVEDMEDMQFPSTVHRLLVSAFQNAFSARQDGEFLPLFQVRYKDTTQMVTVGGCFSRKADVRAVKANVKLALPFLLRNHPYKIPLLNLTERERVLFDLAVTKRRKNSKPANALRALGFKKPQFDAYGEMIRFLPRYHEAIL